MISSKGFAAPDSQWEKLMYRAESPDTASPDRDPRPRLISSFVTLSTLRPSHTHTYQYDASKWPENHRHRRSAGFLSSLQAEHPPRARGRQQRQRPKQPKAREKTNRPRRNPPQRDQHRNPPRALPRPHPNANAPNRRPHRQKPPTTRVQILAPTNRPAVANGHSHRNRTTSSQRSSRIINLRT